MKIFIYFILLSFFLTSCYDDKPKKLYFKKIKTPYIEVEWYQYSLLTSIPPDYVFIKNRDSILFQADNIIDINVYSKDSVVISFCGEPTKYGKLIEIPLSKSINVRGDILTKYPRFPEYRETFTD